MACLQCLDESSFSNACCDGTSKMTCLSMMGEGTILSEAAFKGVCCCCAVGTEKYSCCSPCQMPSVCCKGLSQLFCCHLRCAFPCNDEVQFEIACCGVTLMGGPKEDGAE